MLLLTQNGGVIEQSSVCHTVLYYSSTCNVIHVWESCYFVHNVLVQRQFKVHSIELYTQKKKNLTHERKGTFLVDMVCKGVWRLQSSS